jgi:hypothetical protein
MATSVPRLLWECHRNYVSHQLYVRSRDRSGLSWRTARDYALTGQMKSRRISGKSRSNKYGEPQCCWHSDSPISIPRPCLGTSESYLGLTLSHSHVRRSCRKSSVRRGRRRLHKSSDSEGSMGAAGSQGRPFIICEIRVKTRCPLTRLIHSN